MSAEPSLVREHLLADHRRIEQTFEQLLEAFRVDDRPLLGECWSQFESQLQQHMAFEEEHLIPRLMRVNRAAAQGLLNEHQHIRGRLTELGPALDLHLVRFDVARQFIGELRAHAKHEDELLYGWADEHIGESERRVLLRALVDAALVRVKAARARAE